MKKIINILPICILFFALLAGWFYWFQWRPAQIRKNCTWVKKYYNNEEYWWQNDLSDYRACLSSKGLEYR